MDGLEVSLIIRVDKCTSHRPVVILTLSSHDDDLVNSYKYGANSFIRKSVHFNQLIEAVREFDMSWLVLTEMP